jgi:hypothetical protein
MKFKSEYCNIKEAFTFLLTGNQGNQGPQGVRGSVGDVGLRGLDGSIGIQGPTGDIGIMGNQGFKGDRGEQGQKGLTGRRGDSGVIGVQGQRGDKGPKGWKGPRGKMGNRASAGPSGILGPKGKIGESGSQFSNIGISHSKSESGCIWKDNVDHMLSMPGKDYKSNNSKQNNYCPEGYGMTGIKTSAWSSDVITYKQVCEIPTFLTGFLDFFIGNRKKCVKVETKDGTQILRKYSMKCCPTFSQENIKKEINLDNLDDYKNYDSIKNYPFHLP